MADERAADRLRRIEDLLTKPLNPQDLEKIRQGLLDGAALSDPNDPEWGNDTVAQLIATIAAKREACAKVAEQHPADCDCGQAYGECDVPAHIAAAIRALT